MFKFIKHWKKASDARKIAESQHKENKETTKLQQDNEEKREELTNSN
jgi:hypothetical protein